MEVFQVKREPEENVNVFEIKTEPRDDGFSLNAHRWCVPCRDENIFTNGDGLCRECEDFMCNTCFRHHLKAKQCRNHEFIHKNTQPIKKKVLEDNAEKCKHHDGEIIKLYCPKHEAVGCEHCMQLEHDTCKPEYIKYLSTDFQESETFKSLLTKLEKLNSEVKERGNIAKDKKISNEMWHNQILQQIRTFRNDVDNYLASVEETAISEVNQLSLSNEQSLAKMEEDCNVLLSKIERLKQKVDTNMYHGNVLFIHAFKCKLYLPALEKAVSKIPPQVNIKTSEFVPDRQLSSVIKSKRKLGHFILSNSDQLKPVLQTDTRAYPDSDQAKTACGPRRGMKRRKTEMGQSVMDKTSVGARVRPGPRFTYDWDHRNQPGTITSVEPDRTVTVKWDATGKTWSGYQVGTMWNGVELV